MQERIKSNLGRHEFGIGIQELVEQTKNQSTGVWDADENCICFRHCVKMFQFLIKTRHFLRCENGRLCVLGINTAQFGILGYICVRESKEWKTKGTVGQH